MLSEEEVIKEPEDTVAPRKRERRYSGDEVQAMIDAAVAKALADQKQTVVVQTNDELVTLLYMGACSSDCMVHLHDEIGEIAGRGGTLDIPKKDFLRYRTTPPIMRRLADRRLLVIDGLTDDERKRFGLEYNEGELVSDNVYYALLEMPEDKIVEIFTKACKRHKELIASLIMDAYEAHDNRINQALVQRLNNAYRDADTHEGMFTAILKDMARALADTTAD